MNDLAHDTQNIRTLDLDGERVEKIVSAANAWIAEVPEIVDEETARRADDFLNQITAELKKLDAAEKAAKKPLRDQIAEIGLAYAPLVGLLQTAKNLIGPKVTSWLRRKREADEAAKRRQQEEAARLIREAEEAGRKATARPTVENTAAVERARATALKAVAEAAEPVARVQVRGNFSQRARSIRTLWRAEIEDILQLYLYYKDHPDVRETLQRLANAEAPAAHRESREIPGARLIEREIAA